MRCRARFAGLCLIICVLAPARPSRAADEKPAARVNVILWFDTEDYLLPADDDAAKRLADMLTERQIRATFKVVGEKARVLEKRGRQDVIAALKKHDIGYHSNFHSVHPTPSEYLADCWLLDGIAEFVRREGPGAADVRRIFGVDKLACYGQPGSSWASQTIVALPQIGVAPCYVDDGNHVGIRGKPFWYGGALVVYDMAPNWTRMELHDPAAVEPGKKKVAEIAQRLRNEGGGLISIFYHPCEWVHQEFWDGVNFRRGRNPPREDWKPPPQRTPAETDQAFARFAGYVDFIHDLPGARFVAASDLPAIYPDRVRTDGATAADLLSLAEKLSTNDVSGVDFQVIGGNAYSAADQFELLSTAIAELIDGKVIQYPLAARGLIGPDGLPPAARDDAPKKLGWFAFRDAAIDVRDFIRKEGRVPARVFIGADAVSPADFLVALADAYRQYRQDGKLPRDAGVQLGHNIELLPARHVARDTPNLFGGWIIHKANFRAPRILEVAKLQTWTLKPAMRTASGN
jgi:hypothetical protein